MGATAPLAPFRSRWSLDFAKNVTIFEVSSTAGRYPLASSSAEDCQDVVFAHDQQLVSVDSDLRAGIGVK